MDILFEVKKKKWRYQGGNLTCVWNIEECLHLKCYILSYVHINSN